MNDIKQNIRESVLDRVVSSEYFLRQDGGL